MPDAHPFDLNANDRVARRSRGRWAKTAPARPRQADRAYQEIKRRILDNEIPAGIQTLEQELAEMLGMSRTPVREAVIRLEEDSMVGVRPRRAACSHAVTRQDR